MDDLYCPACRLVLFAAGVAALAPEHCPRCATRERRVALRPRRPLDHMTPRPARAGAPRRSLVEFYNSTLGRRSPQVRSG